MLTFVFVATFSEIITQATIFEEFKIDRVLRIFNHEKKEWLMGFIKSTSKHREHRDKVNIEFQLQDG